MIEPIVTIMYQNLPFERKGRGYSFRELAAAGLTFDDALWIGLPVDKKRKSMHEENIEMLMQLMSEAGVEEETFEEAPAPAKPAQKKAEVPKEDVGIPLEDIPGVGPKTAERLREAGYVCAGDICQADVEELASVKGISKKSAEELIEKAKGL
jgi:predicted flap endonuclease-1-like 5' DNA nuclease